MLAPEAENLEYFQSQNHNLIANETSGNGQGSRKGDTSVLHNTENDKVSARTILPLPTSAHGILKFLFLMNDSNPLELPKFLSMLRLCLIASILIYGLFALILSFSILKYNLWTNFFNFLVHYENRLIPPSLEGSLFIIKQNYKAI